jgi:hypothetical protein
MPAAKMNSEDKMKRLTANSKSTFGIGLPEKLIEANFKGHASYL